ncbi:MAG: DNA repair exonuclease [Clostridia bacterium]|nr:DNA repair exonuclease [Clostridia bacterium]MBQ3554444.1 DNA repair exonuclease [Clostridia bacterium]
MAVKIIHCADLHFDSPFAGLDSVPKAEIRREELRRTFGQIVELAEKERADALFICGDLFDGERVSAKTLGYMREKLSMIPQIPVFISAGNHDPNIAGSYYRILDWGENVHIFSSQMEKIECDGFTVYGASFEHFEQTESKLSGFSVDEPEKINLMVMHADLDGTYNPISRKEIENSGLDYLALGHVHQYSGPLSFGKTVAAYPGCPEGRGFDELGEKGVICASIEKGNVNLRFMPLSRRIYREITVDVSDATSYETLCGRILLAMDGTNDDIYKIVLTGEAEFSIEQAVLLENLPCFAAKIKDKTKAKVDVSALKEEYSLKGLFVKKLSERSDFDSPLVRAALGFGMDAMSKEKVKLP